MRSLDSGASPSRQPRPPRQPRTVVKLGGSLITDKRGDRPRIRRQTLARLASELAAAPAGTLVALVHGAGSFGHGQVLRAALQEGARTRAQRLAWAEIQVLQNELNAEVCRALVAAGLPAMPCQPSAAAVLSGRGLVSFFDEALRGFVEQGLLPVLYGVPALDLRQGCAILSGDILAPELASRLGATRLLYATDVDGVFTADPRLDPAARCLGRITPGTWPEVESALRGSGSVDVTGGMRGKITALLQRVVRDGLSARIFDGNLPGQLLAALRGRSVGTLVCQHP